MPTAGRFYLALLTIIIVQKSKNQYCSYIIMKIEFIEVLLLNGMIILALG
jgi:hypothetical protein